MFSSLFKKGLAVDGGLFPKLRSLCFTSLHQVPVEEPQWSGDLGTEHRTFLLSFNLPRNTLVRKVCTKVHDADFLSENRV